MLTLIKREARFLAIATAIAFVPIVWVSGDLWNPHGPHKTLVGAIVGWFVIVPGSAVLFLLSSFIGNVAAALIAVPVEFVWLLLLSIPLRLMFIGGASVVHRLLGNRKNHDPGWASEATIAQRRGDDCD